MVALCNQPQRGITKMTIIVYPCDAIARAILPKGFMFFSDWASAREWVESQEGYYQYKAETI
jgi:hypothetical protein